MYILYIVYCHPIPCTAGLHLKVSPLRVYIMGLSFISLFRIITNFNNNGQRIALLIE